MAERRMFAKTIIDSDAFLDMPLSAQALYFHLSMRADDDGFVNNPKKIQRLINASDDDLKLLVIKSFLIPFETGIVVIKHWKIHNYIRGDRKHDTKYQEEMAMLSIKENGSYTLCQSNVSQLVDNCPTEVRLGKDSIGKDRLGKDSIKDKRAKAPDYESILSQFAVSDEFKDAINEFIKMRKLIKAPLTERALKLIINKVREMGKTEEEQIAIINQSVANSWKGVFPLKDNSTGKTSRAAEELENFYSMSERWAQDG